MSADKIPKLINGCVGFVDLFAKAFKNLFGLMAEKLNKNVVFILKV
jgi:hypothetical protein